MLGERAESFRFTSDALHLLQLPSELVVTDAAARLNWLAMHARRETVQVHDVTSWERLLRVH